MSKVLVTGSNGQVGQAIAYIAHQFPEFDFVFADRTILDLADTEAIASFFKSHTFSACINCAAYTAVDQAETDSALARKVNVDAVASLAKACNDIDIPLIHLSTDYVYHNQQNTPFKEGDLTNPQGVYAQTKLDGEKEALELNPKSMVIRTSWVYSFVGNNFVKTMLRLGRSRDQLTVIFDQIGSPTFAIDLAEAILIILQELKKNPSKDRPRIYHYSNEGVCSWYDFAQAIFEIKNISCQVVPIETKDYPTPASRPPFSLLNKALIKTTFPIEIPYWKDSLKKCLNHLD